MNSNDKTGTAVALHDVPERAVGFNTVRMVVGLSESQLPNARLLAIQKYAGKDIRDPYDLAVFIGSAHRHGLDPLMGEVFAFPVQGGKIVIYSGRDGYIKAASLKPDYNGHEMGVVYSNDVFRLVKQGSKVEVYHEINGFDRGVPLGGYMIAYGKDKRPVIVTRKFSDYEYLWSNPKKENWQRDPIGMFENRLIRAGLVRIVPLADLHIEGELEEYDRVGYRENRIGKSTNNRLQELRAKVGIEAAEVVEDKSGPTLSDLREAFEQIQLDNHIPDEAVLAWALSTASVPDDPISWKEDHLSLAIQTVRETSGRELVAEWIRVLAASDDSLGADERAGIEAEALGEDMERLLEVANRLRERVPVQGRLRVD